MPPPAYRLPADLRLGRVRLQVADLSRSIAYYERVIGLRTIATTDSSATLGPRGDDSREARLSAIRDAAGRIMDDRFVAEVPGTYTLIVYLFSVANEGFTATATLDSAEGALPEGEDDTSSLRFSPAVTLRAPGAGRDGGHESAMLRGMLSRAEGHRDRWQRSEAKPVWSPEWSDRRGSARSGSVERPTR